jgi:tRNA G10  N-methylase Trm11
MPEIEKRSDAGDWTFNGASTRELTHCYHDYPARMIPQVARKLLQLYIFDDSKLLFDPYCGTGTSLVEGMTKGLNVVGTDLNPLARLIARAKTTVYDPAALDKYISKFNRHIVSALRVDRKPTQSIEGIARLHFWFKPSVVGKLADIKEFVWNICDEKVREFFQVAFSETVRESSNTRNGEFKLYRYNEETLKKFNPDAYAIMAHKLERNRLGFAKWLTMLNQFHRLPNSSVHGFNSVNGIPEESVPIGSVDIVVTSPPYGDSHTTVAYGQYSRLSSAWLGFKDAAKVDSALMGGKIHADVIPELPSVELNDAVRKIAHSDEKRAREVASFYVDYLKSIENVAKAIKVGGYACYVVGNRKVKGVVLPTDIVTKDFFLDFGFDYVTTFYRSIPNKRMPLKNSPTNAVGKVDSTMVQERIVVMRKRGSRAPIQKPLRPHAAQEERKR